MRRIGGVVMRTVFAVLVLALAATAASGCVTLYGPTTQTTPARVTTASVDATEKPPTVMVAVPDVLHALSIHGMNTSYDVSPEAAAAEIKGFASGVISDARLVPDVALQAISLEDTQSPAPGTAVPEGSVVHVKIGFGD